jgi:hypothetical protein
MRKRIKLLKKRENPEFEKFFREHAWLDPVTGEIKVKDCYAYLGFNINWNGSLISVTYANAVWFLKTGAWPKAGHHIDHINDVSLDNRPENLQEITEFENHKKRRGRKVYRSYGRGKYGFGLGIHHDKRDNRFYVDRNLSRGYGTGDLNGIRYSLGGYDTREEAEQVVESHIRVLEVKGLSYIPPTVKRKPKKATVHLDTNIEQMREMRRNGATYQQIADALGLKIGAVYKRIKDI